MEACGVAVAMCLLKGVSEQAVGASKSRPRMHLCQQEVNVSKSVHGCLALKLIRKVD